MKIVALTDVADTVMPDILHQTAILSQTLLVPKQNQAVRNTSISQQAVKPKRNHFDSHTEGQSSR